MADDEVLVFVDDRVATLTINRPERRNALTKSVIETLQGTIRELDADAGVGAIILTGTDPAFSGGMDIKEMAADPVWASTIGLTGPAFPSGTPVIGAINGPAYTGGLELALNCHFLIASERASFADTHATRGGSPGWGLTVLLQEAVGVRRARAVSVASLPFDAATALAWGLVNEVVPHERLLPRALELGRAAAANDAIAVARQLGVYGEQRSFFDDNAWLVEGAAHQAAREARKAKQNG